MQLPIVWSRGKRVRNYGNCINLLNKYITNKLNKEVFKIF